MAQRTHVGLAIHGTVQADTLPNTSETDTRRTQIVFVGSWRAKWIASSEKRRQEWLARQRRQKREEARQHMVRRKACLTRLYQTRADMGMNDTSDMGEPFLRYLARTYMADLRMRAVRSHLRHKVMTPADYAEMMIWYRRAQKECGRPVASAPKKEQKKKLRMKG